MSDGVWSCWLWTAAKDTNGYGVFGIGSRTDGSRRVIGAHRFAYQALVGPIPDGLELDHLCRVRACVNPWHAEAVTRAENVRREYEVNGRERTADGRIVGPSRP